MFRTPQVVSALALVAGGLFVAGCTTDSSVRIDPSSEHIHLMSPQAMVDEPGGAVADTPAESGQPYRLVAGDELGLAMFRQYVAYVRHNGPDAHGAHLTFVEANSPE